MMYRRTGISLCLAICASFSESSLAEPLSNRFHGMIEGWQTTCDLEQWPGDPPSNCNAILPLEAGIVTMHFFRGTVSVSVIGKCGNDVGRQATLRQPVIRVEETIARLAAINIADCDAPDVPSKALNAAGNVNSLLAVLTRGK